MKKVSTTNDSRWHSSLLEHHGKEIYQADGFLAPWYFALRAAEEAARSERYERPLTVIVLETADDPASIKHPPRFRQKLEAWLADKLRNTDLICQGEQGQYFILLIETDEASAWEVSQRLLEQHPSISINLATLASDSARFDALLYKLNPVAGLDLRFAA